jgi:NhaP-type Na+/H+ or K+/H+ antiporter
VNRNFNLIGVSLTMPFDEFDIYQLAILATILAATDAALVKTVVTNKAVPSRIREGLNTESGFNDGLCVPILFTFVALAVGVQGEGSGFHLALKLVAREIGIGLVVGLGLTAIGVLLFRIFFRQGWINEIWLQMTAVALAVGCFAVAQSLHGSGYVAAFVGGMLFGSLTKSETHRLMHASEGTAETLALLTWVVFGSAVIGKYYDFFTWNVLLYALLSLTVIRMLPIVLALVGTGESMAGKLFLGWFGPRGLASVVFLIIVIDEKVPGNETMAITVVCTVTLSILLHGLTARPLANWFAAQTKGTSDDGEIA